MKYSITTFAALAEIISSVAVLVTLIFLFVELQNNTEILEREQLLNRNSVSSEFFINNPQLIGILEKIKVVDSDFVTEREKAFMENYNLSYPEASTWIRYLTLDWLNRQSDFLYSDLETRETIRKRGYAGILRNPDQKLYWEHTKDNGFFNEEFVKVVSSSGL